MRRLLPALSLISACALAAVIGGCSGPATHAHRAAAHRAPPVSYYLALGDSLSQGVQPDAAGVSVSTPDGYPDQLYALLRARQPGLRLVKLGCMGETTATMIKGGICRYAGGSQLTAAMRFLRAHRRVSLITLDIGANDPDSCITQPSVSKLADCVGKSIPEATTNLVTILARLRSAAPHTRIIAMNYYLPTLAEWRNGLVGEAIARLIEPAAAGYNNLLGRVYQQFGVRVANVFGAFQTGDFSHQAAVPGFGMLPRNVADICRWTWECAPPPRGPNVHANQAGYQVIAHAFLAADTA
ncbi:MAG TPA: SGNH/GDSL hydrolase family protein [Streptosporangiaceae bacterium]